VAGAALERRWESLYAASQLVPQTLGTNFLLVLECETLGDPIMVVASMYTCLPRKWRGRRRGRVKGEEVGERK